MSLPSSSADLQLTTDQQGAVAAFSDWLTSPADGSPFVLSGYAGTGKTFLSMRFLAQAEAAGLCWTVVAPTHKAVGVLRSHLAMARLQATWFPSTIHRLLRLKLKRQGDLERCEETEQTAMALEHLGLVLIDEASMVDSTLLDIALRCAHPFRTRLVFVGDPAQLPPVGEPQSPVFAMARAAAAVLTEEQQAQLNQKVRAIAGSKAVEFDLVVDPSLIGGFIVSMGSQVIDASLSGQVRRLGLALAQVS